jgi:hypothetical protein
MNQISNQNLTMFDKFISLILDNISSISKFLQYTLGITIPVFIYWQTTWWGSIIIKCCASLIIGFFGAMGAYFFTTFIASKISKKLKKYEKKKP